jgi:hypothetical protein
MSKIPGVQLGDFSEAMTVRQLVDVHAYPRSVK